MKKPPTVHYCRKPRCAATAVCGVTESVRFAYKLKDVTCKDCLEKMRKKKNADGY